MSALSGLGRFAAGYLRGRPRTVFLEVTLRCNARCEFCRYWSEPAGEEMADFRPIVKHFSPLSVTLTGGEPLLRRDICQIVSDIKCSSNTFVSLITNGIRLDVERAKELRSAGLDGLSISLNHPNQAQDEEKQVPGLYAHLEEVMPHLAEIGFRRLSLNTVLMANNLSSIPEIVARARAWRMGLTVSCYSTKKADDHAPVICEAQTAELEEVVAFLAREASSGCVQNSPWYLNRILQFHRRKYVPGCTAGRRTIHVTPQGMVRPCPDLPIVSHWSTYAASTAVSPRCGACWYACRGEVQAPLTPGRIISLARYVKSRPSPSPGGRQGP
jgi:MoaA/NifB/PqqE/SkfB family radical SAM enzyme